MSDEPKDDRPIITWTVPKLERFKKAHANAAGSDFTFDGHEFVYGYATYLIEYLEFKLRGRCAD